MVDNALRDTIFLCVAFRAFSFRVIVRWEIRLQRKTKNRLNTEITQRKLRQISKIVEQNASLGFEGQVAKLREPERTIEDHEEVYVYNARITLQSAVATEDSFNRYISETLKKTAESEGWHISSTLAHADFNQNLTQPPHQPGSSREPFIIPELSDSAIAHHFRGIYEREPHARMIHKSMAAYVESNGERRSHILLEGPPACCKTILFSRFKEFYEQEGDGVERVAFVDGPTMSKAGLENWILQMVLADNLPEVICIEEIEKQNMDNLLTLLSIMGSGYIMRTNARIGRVKEIAKCLVWATCNDKQLLRRFRDGALWSRFTHKLHCGRPSRELMRRILSDEVSKIGGDMRWVDAIDSFCYDEIAQITGQQILDPREILGFLDGQDSLLDGTYQEDYIATLCQEDIAIYSQQPEVSPPVLS